MKSESLESLFGGTWALVTGASSGLGEEFARQLAVRRANLVLTARRTERLESLAAQLRKTDGVSVEIVSEDLGAAGGADRLCDEIARRGLRVNHLVSNAGFGQNGPFLRTDGARHAEMVRVNCEALVVLSRRLLPAMVEQHAGGVIHVASIAGMQPVPFMSSYGATKAYVLNLSLGIAEELSGSGVRVMALCPGPVPTGFQRVAGSAIAPSQSAAVLSPEECVEWGLRDYARGKVISVPGRINTVQATVAHFVPRSILLKTVARMMKAKGRAD